jgi:ABC-type lipoprotein release transport system permease subunit
MLRNPPWTRWLAIFEPPGIGLVGALLLTRLLNSLLFGVGATDPPTFAAIALLLTLVALAASYLPAQRTARTDPMVSLRSE